MTAHDTAILMAESCLAVRVRRVHRVVTSIFDDALRPLGVTTARGNLLVAIAVAPGLRPSALGASLDLDKSTLSRALGGMAREGLIAITLDGRSQRLHLTPTGEDLLRLVRPRWEQAQQAAREALGPVADALLARYPMPGSP